MKLLFELSGEHPTLPVAELECVGRVTDLRRQVAVADCPEPGAAARLALTHVVMEYIGECAPSLDAFRDLLREGSITAPGTFAGRVRKMDGAETEESRISIERVIGSMIRGRVALKNPETEYRAIISGDRCYFGRVLLRPDRRAFECRNPMRRPFFHPGVIMPKMARALVNISLVSEGELFCDPFCGTGGVLLEAQAVGAAVVGSDFDPMMVAGCRRNLPHADLMLADATSLPLISNSAGAVVTDLPYGQSVRVRAPDMDRLYAGAFGEIRRILIPGRRAVVVTHRDVSRVAGDYMEILQIHRQRVHKSLTRHVLVLKKQA